MKQVLILTLGLWITHATIAQTKWIAHKSHSGKMNTFSLKSPDNLGCGRGDFLELKVSNFDVLGNECTRPIILPNGMVIKDPKLDSVGFSASHKEINKLAQADSVNYYPYKKIYDSIRMVNYPTEIIPEIIEESKNNKKQRGPVDPVLKNSKKNKRNKRKLKGNINTTFNLQKPIDLEAPVEIIMSNIVTGQERGGILNKAGLPLVPLSLLVLLGGIIVVVRRAF